MRWITDNLKRAAWLIGAALAVTVLTAIGADVVQLGLDVIGPHATTKNARAIVFTGSGVSTNTSAGGTNTVTISGGAAVGLFTGSGTTGTVTSAAGDAGKFLKADGTFGLPTGASQMFASQVSTNGNYNMQVADIGKLFSYDVTSDPVFVLTNANLFASGQAIGFNVTAGYTNNLSNRLEVKTVSGNTIGATSTNTFFSSLTDSAVFVSDGSSKWHPLFLSQLVMAAYRDDTDISVTQNADTAISFNETTVYLTEIDTHNIHSNSTNTDKFYIPEDGNYVIYAYGSYVSTNITAGKRFRIGIYKNGDVNTLQLCDTENNTVANAGIDLAGTTQMYLQKGEYITYYTSHNDTGARTLLSAIILITKAR